MFFYTRSHVSPQRNAPPSYLVKALQHVYHLVVCVGGILHSHTLVSFTGNEACMQEEEQSLVLVRTIETTVTLKWRCQISAGFLLGGGEWRINESRRGCQ